MLTTILAQAILIPTFLFPSSTPIKVQAKGGDAPPSTVTLKSVRATIGAAYKEIRALMEDNEAYRTNARALDAETPQHSVPVETFHVMVTEVTNEQYAAFVSSSGHRPPFEWGEEACNAAALAYLKEEGERRKKAREEGKPLGKRAEKFDKPAWWANNWQEAEWQIPKDGELRPVTHVDYADAQDYAAWAGMRLPTEIEYQRAARGKAKQPYPWGEEWVDGKFAATREIKRINKPKPVGSFPEGQSKEGIFDLAGNAWEWTNSRYVAYVGFKKNKYKFGKGNSRDLVEPQPAWDANQRVVVGGCFQNSKLVARVTTRRATDRSQMTNAMGFRCVATAKQGVDIAQAVFNRMVKNSTARPGDVTYLPTECAATDRWSTRASLVTETPEGYEVPKGYEVIDGYDYILFTPIEKSAHSSMVALDKASLTDPQHLGFLTTSQALLEPELPAGTYLIAYRSGGKTQTEEEEEGEDEPAEEEVEEVIEDPRLEGVDLKQDTYIFYDAAIGRVMATVEAKGLRIDKLRGPSALSWDTKKIWVGGEGGAEKIQKEQKWLALDASIQGKIRNRGIRFEMRFLPNEKAGRMEWRTTSEK